MNKKADLREIKEKVKKIIISNSVNELQDIDDSEEIPSGELNISARDMVVFLYEIEREFNIVVPMKVVLDRKFNSVNNIAIAVSDVLDSL